MKREKLIYNCFTYLGNPRILLKRIFSKLSWRRFISHEGCPSKSMLSVEQNRVGGSSPWQPTIGFNLWNVLRKSEVYPPNSKRLHGSNWVVTRQSVRTLTICYTLGDDMLVNEHLDQVIKSRVYKFLTYIHLPQLSRPLDQWINWARWALCPI
jgi:hypothetical protein